MLSRRAGGFAPDIRARLTISAKRFVGWYKSLLELLPAVNITVRLAGYEVPLAVIELIPLSVARENVLLPLNVPGWALLIAAADPHDYDTAQKLQFILNRDVVLVRAEREDVQQAIERYYGQSEVEYVDEYFIEFADTERTYDSIVEPPEMDPNDAAVVRLVDLILCEATNLTADRILFYPDIDAVGVRYRVDGEWAERDRIPLRLLQSIAARIALLGRINFTAEFTEHIEPNAAFGEFSSIAAGRRINVRVAIDSSPDGPTTQLDIAPVHS